MDDNSQYLDIFFEETDENLLKLNEWVLEFEKDPTDIKILNDIFRAAHTLKGMAGTMGFETMIEVTHHLENVFTVLKDERIIADEEVISLVFSSLDALSEIVADLRNGQDIKRDYSTIIQTCERIFLEANHKDYSLTLKKDTKSTVITVLDEADWEIVENTKLNNFHAYSIHIEIESTSIMVGARAFLLLNKLEEFGHVLKTQPTIEVLESEDFGHEFQIFYVTELEKNVIEEMIMDQNEVEAIYIERLEKDTVTKEVEGPTIEENKPATKVNQPHNQFVRVDLEKLDAFMNLVSELVIYRTQLEDISQKTNNKKLEETLTYVSRITDQLQSLVLNIRMQPLHTVTSRFPRVVRDLANESGKSMELIVEGDDTELDRTIVSELSEPLIHLIRNSADHGIESPDRRIALGKPEKGIIKISAYQEGNRVFITVSDDGAGLDTEAIKKSAERKGIPTDDLSKQEIQELIFHPGFSTAEKVTKISGRGVGMDVVKTKIKELGGSIDIKSEPHMGTAFRLSLPLTLSIIPALLVRVGTHTFAIPLSIIGKVIHIEKSEIRQTHNGEVLIDKGKTIPIIHLAERLGIGHEESSSSHIVMVTIEGNEYALCVHSIIGQQEIVIKELGQEFMHQKYYLGATVMGDGRIILILNVTAICLERNATTYVQ